MKNSPVDAQSFKPTLSIIIPCYNEENSLPHAIKKLSAVLETLKISKKISKESFCLFVDDGSKDRTWDIISRSENKSILGIKLSSNAGHQTALIAGMEYVKDKCDCLISIDADLQQDENAIGRFIDKYSSGADIVLGVRNSRNTDSFFKKITAEVFYKLMKWMKVNIVRNAADFRLLSARANKAVLEHKEVNIFLRGIVLSIGFNMQTVYFDVKEREYGQSKYTWSAMFSFAFDAIFAFSIFPIRVITLFGVCSVFISMILTFYVVYFYFKGDVVPGWSSTTIPLFFFGGIQMFSFGIIGEYIGRIYKESKKRPRYFINKICRGGGGGGG